MWSLGKVLNTPEVVRVYIGYVIHFFLVISLVVSFFFKQSDLSFY